MSKKKLLYTSLTALTLMLVTSNYVALADDDATVEIETIQSTDVEEDIDVNQEDDTIEELDTTGDDVLDTENFQDDTLLEDFSEEENVEDEKSNDNTDDQSTDDNTDDSSEEKLRTEIFGTEVKEEILPLKLSFEESFMKGKNYVKSTVDSLPNSTIYLNILIVDKDGKEMSVGKEKQEGLSASSSLFSTLNYPDGNYTLIVSGYTGYKSNYQRYEGRLSFEIKNGGLVKELNEVINTDVIAGVSQFPLEIEDIIRENAELINITQEYISYNKRLDVKGYLDWKPQQIEFTVDVYNDKQKLVDTYNDSNTNSLELYHWSGVSLDNYPDGIYTIKITAQADGRDDNQEFIGYSAFEIRKGRYVGIVPVLVTPKKMDDGQTGPDIPELEELPDKNLPKDNPDVDIIPEDNDKIPDDTKQSSTPKSSDTKQSSSTKSSSKTETSSSTNKSTDNSKSSSSDKGTEEFSSSKKRTTTSFGKNNSSSSDASDFSKTKTELGDDTNKEIDTDTSTNENQGIKLLKSTANKPKFSLPSTGEVVSGLGVVGLGVIAIAVYILKKRKK